MSRREALAAAGGGIAALGLSTPAAAAAQAALPDGADPGAVHVVGLFGELDSPSVPRSARCLLSSGYRVPGKGIALYTDQGEQGELTEAGRRLLDAAVAADPQSAATARTALLALERHWRVQAADGRWFTLASSHDSDMFGTLGDAVQHQDPPFRFSGTVVTRECQAYLDYCTYFANEPCRWSAGSHLVDDVLHAGYGDTFRQTLMKGAGAKFEGEAGFSGTAFFSTRRDRPLFNFAGQRRALIEDLFLVGLFRGHRRASWLGAAEAWTGPSPASNGRHDVEPEAWVDPAAPASADSRHAPHAGIAVDGYAGERPEIAYPSPRYPAWLPRLRPWSGAALSSVVTISRTGLSGFVVGLAVNPSTTALQGDYVRFEGGHISECKWAISVGNHQSRGVSVRDSQITACWCALANNSHGAQSGHFGATIDSVSFGEVMHLMDFNNYAANLVFLACYAEAVWRLGWYSGGNAFSGGPAFHRCNFELALDNPARGRPATLLSDRFGPGTGGFGTVDLPGTILAVPSVAVLHKQVGGGALLVQPQERTGGLTGSGREWRRHAANAMHGGLATPGFRDGAGLTLDSPLFDLDTGAFAGKQQDGSPAPRSIGSSQYVGAVASAAPGDRVPRPQAVHVVERGAIVPGSVERRGREVAFTIAHPLDPYRHGTLLGMGPGGVWMDAITGTILWCRAADYAARRLTFELQNNFRTLAGAVELVESVDWHRRGLEFQVVHGRWYTPLRPLLGDFAAGSPLVRNVRPATGAEGSEPEVAAGDGLFLLGRSGLEHAGRIERIAPGEILLSDPAPADRPGERLALFVRVQPPNGPPAWPAAHGAIRGVPSPARLC